MSEKTEVFFATNRNPDNHDEPTDFGKNFSENGLTNLRYGRALVGKDEIELSVAGDVGEGAGKLGSEDIMFQVKDIMMRDKRDTLVFIHGFNTDFRGALRTAASVAQKYGPINVVVFSWPSDGSVVPIKGYVDDRNDAKASAVAFARAIMKFADFIKSGPLCGQRVHLLAHSMGNYVLRWTIQEITKMTGGGIPRLFDEVFLMAADADDDVLELDHKLRPLIHACRNMNVYFNRGDKALLCSDWTKGNPDRLGTDGPRHPLTLANKITLVDCSDVVSGLLEHSYFHEEERVVRDVLAVLAGTKAEEIQGRRYDARKNRFILS